MKIKEFILNYEKVYGRYECELFLPHVSGEIPVRRFTVKGIREAIKSLKDLSVKFNLSELKMSDFENETQAAEDLYKELNLIISANY